MSVISRLDLKGVFIRILPGLIVVIVIQSLAISFVNVPIYGDSEEYMLLGKNIHDRGLYSFDGTNPSRMRQPVYPTFLCLTYYSMGESFLVVKLIQAFAGLLTFLFTMCLFGLVCGSRHIRLASVCVGAYVPLWWNCAIILSEPIAILLVAAFLLLLYGITTRWSPGRCVAAGIFLGLAILTRPIAIALLGLVWIPVVFNNQLKEKKIASLAVIVATCLVTLLPWTLRNYQTFGKLTPLSAEGEYHAFRAANFAAELPMDSIVTWEALRDKQSSGTLLTTIIDEVRLNPINYIWNGIKRVFGSWIYFPGSRNFFDYVPARVTSYAAQSILLILAAVGFYRFRNTERWFLIYPALSFSVVIFFSSEGISRLLLPVMPPVLIMIVIGIITLMKQFGNEPLEKGTVV
ncbi:MAG: hypothetical protein WBP29_14515 [Candidatus Zixiibacteriota bacterium]